jgi:hypothetical protein
MPKHDAAIESIKQLVTSHPVLRYYDVKEEITIQCDASDVGCCPSPKWATGGFCYKILDSHRKPTVYAQIEKRMLGYRILVRAF